MMIWRLIRAGFPERATKDLRPEVGITRQSRAGRVFLQRTVCAVGGEEGQDLEGRGREQRLEYLVGERERERQTDRHREGSGESG